MMERRQTGAKSIDPAMRGRGGRCRGESRSLGMGGKRKQVETKAYYTVQAQTKAEESTRSVWTGGGGDEALGVGARRTRLPVSAGVLVCKPARQSKRREVLVSGLGMPDSRDWGRTSVGAWGLCRDEQRLRRRQDEGDGETGHGGE